LSSVPPSSVHAESSQVDGTLAPVRTGTSSVHASGRIDAGAIGEGFGTNLIDQLRIPR
jgi:hypothetical protein